MFIDREKTTGCNFTVRIPPIEVTGNFSKISGLTSEVEYETYNEGGNFTAPVILPKFVKYPNIVLERGTAPLDPITLWFTSIQAGIHQRYPMLITMLDNAQKTVKIWTVMDAMPVKIDYTPLDAMSKTVSITSFELAHGEIITVM